MKHLFIVILLLFSSKVQSCGWSYENDTYSYYNILSQAIALDDDFHLFLRDHYNTFYSYQDEFSQDSESINRDKVSGNIKLWRKLLPNFTDTEIENVLYMKPDFEVIWSQKKAPHSKDIKHYIDFANLCSDLVAPRSKYTWEYSELLKETPSDFTNEIETGIKRFLKTDNEQLKQRYAYQIIRLYHYGKNYQEAIDFYETNTLEKFSQNEIYYYYLEQVAGCYRHEGKCEISNKLFLEVVSQSQDRKVSASLSYNFGCKDLAPHENVTYDPDLEITRLLTSHSGPENDLTTLNQLSAIDLNNSKVEIYFMRKVNLLERYYNPSQSDMISSHSQYFNSETDLNTIFKKLTDDLLEFCEIMVSNDNLIHKDFWKMNQSYLHFLKKDLPTAQRILKSVKNVRLQAEKEKLEHVYKIHSWDAIDSKAKEVYLGKLFSERNELRYDYYFEDHTGWKSSILNYVSHLYLKQGDYAKSFLCFNQREDILSTSSLELVNDLIDLLSQSEKNKWEESLLENIILKQGEEQTMSELTYLKGLFLLQKDKVSGAKKVFEPIIGKKRLFSQKIPSRVFSNNTLECFGCEMESIMVDSVYLAPLFSFIPSEMTKYELAEVILQLKEMSTSDSQTDRRLSSYLLANYYFNVDNTGYFRGDLRDESNQGNYRFFSGYRVSSQTADDLIRTRKAYNSYHTYHHKKLSLNLIGISLDYYQNVLQNSTDQELNARCLYMSAKCELNQYYNSRQEDYNYYNPKHENIPGEFLDSFSTLSSEYEDTEFYKMIIEECSYFEQYCSQN